MSYLSPTLTILTGAVKKAAGALTRDFNELEHLQSGIRNDGMFALRSYEKAKNILLEEIKKYKPSYAVVIEKDDVVPHNGNYFAVSPINGFFNFAHGNSNFAISVALIEKNNIIAGVVYAPITDEMFFAEKGYGAFKEGFRNQERLRVSGCKAPEHALIAGSADITTLSSILKISPHVNVSNCTSLDLAYTAAAKIDAVISANNGIASLAAGILLVKEAGGYIFTIGDKDTRSEDLFKALHGGNIVACNEALRQKIADKTAN